MAEPSPRESQRTLVTIKQVAERAQVHAATVSRALNPETETMISKETRDRIQAVANEMGYKPLRKDAH